MIKCLKAKPCCRSSEKKKWAPRGQKADFGLLATGVAVHAELSGVHSKSAWTPNSQILEALSP